MNDLDKAREWAGRIIAQEPDTQATCRVIQSLPDQWVDAEKLRYAIESLREEGDPGSDNIADALESLLPTPPLRTLADMTPEDREACRWMQAISDPDSGYTDGPVVIVQVQDDRSMLMWEDGSFDTRYHQHITPLPDLPKLEWPSLSVSDESEAVSVETEESEGLPRPEDVPAGEPWLVRYEGRRDQWVGTRDDSAPANYPWALAKIDGKNYVFSQDVDITLISRLVPEVTP